MKRRLAATFVVGTSIHKAPKDALGPVAVPVEELPAALDTLRRRCGLDDVVLVSTCNRTEVYGRAADNPVDAVTAVSAWFDERGKDAGLAPHHRYALWGEPAVSHLFCVAAGLDSLILGETEIVGQLQTAFDTAVQVGAVQGFFVQMFTSAFRASKRVRTETAISSGTTSVASAAVHLAERVSGDLSQRRVLVLGAGDTGRLVAVHLRDRNAGIFVANRTHERAVQLAAQVQGTAIPFSDYPKRLGEFDAVICATASKTPLITAAHLRGPVRNHTGMIHVIDISMPPNVAPDAADLPHVLCSDMGDLEAVVAQNLERRRKEKPAAEAIVAQEVAAFFDQQRTADVGPFIANMRDAFEQVRRKELDKWRNRVPEDTLQVVDQATRALMNKWLHPPTAAVRRWAQDDALSWERMRLVRMVLGIDTEEETS